MRRTAIYIRVSSEKQSTEGESIPAQRSALRKYIDDHPDLTFAGEYLDDGISGTKLDRDELQKLLDDVKAGRIDLILVTKLDRWFRSIRHYINTQELLDKYKVGWLAIWEPIYDSTTPQGRLIINQMMSIAQFEAENTGSRIRQVQAYKVSQGEVISGTTSPGYKIEKKHLVPNEDASNVVEAFHYYSMTGSLTKTIQHCQGMHGIPRTKPGLKNMLMRTIYIGLHRDNPDFCPPLVDKALFYDVQRKLRMNIKKSQKYSYIFSGLITCRHCGHKMGASQRIYHRQKGEVPVHFYRCVQHFGPVRRCPNSKMIRENVLERYLLENIKKLIPEYIAECKRKAAPAKTNQNRISTLEKKITKLKDLYINDLISIDEYKHDKETWLAEIEELKKEDMPQVVDTSQLERIMEIDINAVYADMSPEEKRFFWRSFIKEIVFDNDRNIEIFF